MSARRTATTTSWNPAASPPGTSSTPAHGRGPDPAWAAAQGIGKTDPYAATRARIAALRASGPLPQLRPYYSPQRAGVYLGGLLERNGFDEKGRPLPARGGG